MRVLTWNTLYASATTSFKSPEDRFAIVRDTVLSAAPDVVAFQEFEQHQLGFALPGYRSLAGEPTGSSHIVRTVKRSAPAALLAWGLIWFKLGPPPWSFAITLLHAVLFAIGVLAPLLVLMLVRYRGPFRPPGEFLPILYREDRLRPVAEGTVWMSNRPHVPQTNFPLQFEPRVAHWARFAPLDGGPEFLFINAHLGHAPWHYAGSARVLLSVLERERPAADAPAYLVGDFNALPTAGVMVRLRRVFRDAWAEAARREGPDTTFQWFLARGMTPLRLDHLLFAGPVRPVFAAVLTPRADGRPPSDHDPLVVDFEPSTA